MMEQGISPADIAAVTGGSGRNDGDFGNSDAWVLIILFALIFGNGFGGYGNGGGNGLTQAELCNSTNFNNLQNAVGRLNDQMGNYVMNLNNGLCQNGYETLRNFNEVQGNVSAGFAGLTQQISQCCCDLQRGIDSVNYNSAMNTASINQTTVEQTQKILDAICGNRMADMQNQINQLNLANALQGVVRYPNGLTYNAGFSPFCNCGCGNGNI